MINEFVLVVPEPEIDVASSRKVGAELYAAMERAERFDVVLDLASVTFVDSTGVGMLIGMRNKVEEHGGSIRLRNVAPTVVRLLQLLGLTDVLPITD